MRWLLIAALLVLPLSVGCNGASKSDDTEATEGASMKYKCADCGSESDEAKDCCDKPMAAVE